MQLYGALYCLYIYCSLCDIVLYSNRVITKLLYFAWARSKVKVCLYFHILWRRAILARLPENIAHLGKYSTLGKNKCSVTYPAIKQCTNRN